MVPSHDLNDISQRNLIRELISLRRQAAETYERRRKEDEDVDDAGNTRYDALDCLLARNY